MVWFLNSWKQIVKTIVRYDAWLTELSFRRKKNSVMHALEKRYYQNKPQLPYNFGSVNIQSVNLSLVKVYANTTYI